MAIGYHSKSSGMLPWDEWIQPASHLLVLGQSGPRRTVQTPSFDFEQALCDLSGPKTYESEGCENSGDATLRRKISSTSQ